MISVRYPGKLYLLGEYNVMEPGHTALVIPVNRYLEVKGSLSACDRIESRYGVLEGDSIFDLSSIMPHVSAAMETSRRLLEYHHIVKRPVTLNIVSELDSKDNVKYGFGSSGVVIVAVIDAVLKLHNLSIDSEVLFKAAVFAQYLISDLSSGGELAAAVYQKPLAYTRYYKDVLTHGIDCIYDVWEGLKVETITFDYKTIVGWTKKSFNSTNNLIQVNKKAQEDSQGYYQQIEKAQNVVQHVLQKEISLAQGFQMYRQWMLEFEKWAQIEIETQSLRTFNNLANDYGWSAKVSGAGGGDCALAIHLEGTHIEALKQELKLNHIEILEGVIHDTIYAKR